MKKIIRIGSTDIQIYLRQLMQNPAYRAGYFASRAWKQRKQALAIRSNGICERCQKAKYEIAHHLTYVHFGEEYLQELQALCRECHDYLHARSDYDPVKDARSTQLLLFANPN